MDQFCGSNFWDSNVTWYTEDPDLTECFQKTVLVWTPCTFLWVFLPIEAKLLYNSRTKNIPWTWLSITKFILTVALILMSVLELGKSISNFWSGAKIYDVDIYTPGIKFITFTLAFVLLIYNKKYGMRTSGVLWSFWLLFSLYGVIQFRSSLKKINDETEIKLDFVINTSYFAIVVLLFLLNFLIDAEPTESEYLPATNPSPEQKAAFPSLLVFSWFTSFVWKGFRRPIAFSDLWSLNPEHSAEEVVSNFDRYWNKNDQSVETFEESITASAESMNRIHISNAREGKTSILPPLFKAFGSTYLIGVTLKIVQDILTFTSPQILGLLIDFINDEDDPMWKGYFYAMLILLTALVQTLVGSHYYNKMFIVGLRIRTALIATIYRKTLRVSSSAKQSYTVGEIVNLMSVDAQKFMNLFTSANMIWSAPLQILLALFFLWRILGVSIFVGLAVMIFFIPINGFIARQIEKLEIEQMEYSDRRMKLINEILSGIKVLKLYAWELPFQKQVLKIRNEEIGSFRRTAYYEAYMSFFWSCAPFLVCLASFATFVLIDENNVIDSKTAFVSLSLFNLLEFPMSFLPFAINSLVQLSVSTRRINRFLNCKELDSKKIQCNQSDDKRIIIENGDFSWDSGDNELNLQNIDVKIEKCELIAIVGSVGSGKSSLISAMLGEMRKISGRVNLQGTVAYVSQQPWIQNATVKNNILFGNSLDEEFYSRVLETCALSQDLRMLPAGDQTEIGEQGINLSGGQKQRVALARAVYNNSDIYLLDDPLSAVDSHVGKHIFNHVIGPNGLLKNKIRVLVTHGILHLPQADNIIVLKDGEISERGSYEELLNKRGAFANIIKQQQQSDERGANDSTDSNDFQEKSKNTTDSGKEQLSSKTQQWTSGHQPSTSFVDRDLENKISDHHVIGERLIEEETAEVGGVKWEVYVYFMKSLGWLVVLSAPIMCVFSELCGVGSSIWLSVWSSENDNTTNKTLETSQRDMYLGVYGALGIGRGLSSSLSTLSISFGSLVASEKTFELLVKNILRSPMSFFDTTPNGRILNRFSKDIDIIDNELRVTLDQLLNGLMNVIGTVSVISYSTPIFMLVIIPLGITYYLIQRFNIATSRQLNRLESVSRSSIYSHFSESITGAQIIRAFGAQQRFIKESLSRVDLNHVSYYPTNIAERWTSVRLETAGSFLVFFAALFSVLAKDSISPGLVGLSVSYAFLITQTLSWLINVVSDLETEIVAVERIKEYSDIIQEAAWDVPDTNPDIDWPISGRIEFHNLDIRYREGLELVLEGLNLSVRAGEKIGIVGRTGAGKSSLTIALFRIVEAANGKILIDGVDISKLGLHALRSRLTIIPQDPVLFSGTLRFNLDPASKFSDDQLWRALEQAHLKHFVQNLSNNLMYQVFEGGDNFSVGQRQLICLARALLRKTKVLILDEATAAVDLETDDLIQQTIREQFRDCTILTIAHRLNTIIDSDRVVVLDKGSIIEFDSPKTLLQKPKSLFYAMANDAGLFVQKSKLKD